MLGADTNGKRCGAKILEVAVSRDDKDVRLSRADVRIEFRKRAAKALDRVRRIDLRTDKQVRNV